MKKFYRIWTGDGSMIDGTDHDTFDEALASIAKIRGWSDPVLAVYADYAVETGQSWCVYGSQAEADADAEVNGAFADTITELDVACR